MGEGTASLNAGINRRPSTCFVTGAQEPLYWCCMVTVLKDEYELFLHKHLEFSSREKHFCILFVVEVILKGQ